MPDGPVFIVFAFIIWSFDGAGGAAAMTAAVVFLAQCFPDNVGSVMVILCNEWLVCEPLLGDYSHDTIGWRILLCDALIYAIFS